MIEKMKFLSIAGPKDDIDRVVEQYLSKYEIHLENALSELKTVASLRPYTETNPYKAELQTAAGLMESYHSHLTQTSSCAVCHIGFRPLHTWILTCCILQSIQIQEVTSSQAFCHNNSSALLQHMNGTVRQNPGRT